MIVSYVEITFIYSIKCIRFSFCIAIKNPLKKQYLEKEEQHQVEVNILKGKLEEKDKLLRFQDSTKILDDIHSSQRSPAIKAGLGFYESVECESS